MTAGLYHLADACILPGFDGTTAPDWLRRRAADGLAGAVLYHANMAGHEELRVLTSALRSENPDFLIGIDEEGGDVTRLYLAQGSPWPGNLALGYVDDLDLTSRVARDIGETLAALGVNLDFAPGADVNTEAANPVIGTRSFGADAARVAAHTAAFVRGLQSAGIAACAKHFPGHGATVVDSHHELPTVDTMELGPFRAAVAAGVEAVMTAHILVRGVDDVPATLSHRILADVLRGELGYDGVVITDSMEMRAVHDRYGIAETGVRAIAAGADALCVGTRDGEQRYHLVREALVAAVRDGRLPEERLAEAAFRVRRMAARVRVADRPAARGPGGTSGTGGPVAIGLDAARRALLVRDIRRPLGSEPFSVFEFGGEPNPAVGAAFWGLSGLLPVEALDLAHVPARPIIAVVRDLHRHPDLRTRFEQLLRLRPDTVVVDMGLPHDPPPSPTAYLATHGASRSSAVAALEHLLGRPVHS